MRVTRAFIVRLLVDSDEPQALHGMIQSVGSGEEQPFADGPTLLASIRRMAGQELTDGDHSHYEPTDHEERKGQAR